MPATLPLLSALASGCEGAEPTEELAATEMPTGATCPEDNLLTYESFAVRFFEHYCLRCHSSMVTGTDRQGAPNDHNFDSEIEILGVAEHIDERVGAAGDIVNTIMPPSDPRPSEAERRQLAEYLACAVEALENPNSTGG